MNTLLSETIDQESAAFPAFAADARPRVDAALEAYTEFAAPSEWGRECPPALREAMRYSLLAPGKRLRPLLALLAARACGADETAALPAACAVEMVHAYSLIHDDLPAMDDDDLRRGRPTCHKVYGEALAILAGDALLALAFDVLARDVQPPEAAARCCRVLAGTAGATALVGGQVDDLTAEGKISRSAVPADNSRSAVPAGNVPPNAESAETADLLVAIHARKTAAMLMASVELGGICAAATEEQLAALRSYGYCLGLAFQIKDDLLDVNGDETALGKRVGKDSTLGKLTYPGLIGVEKSQRRAASLMDEAREALLVFGGAATDLAQLARYVVERDR